MRRLVAAAILAAVIAVTAVAVGHIGPFREDVWAMDGVNADHASRRDDNVPIEEAGPSHCGWDDVTFISFRGGVFLRGSDGKALRMGGVEYGAVDALPDDATFSGWAKGDQELWADLPGPGSEGAPRSLYVVSGDGIERLPRFPVGCA
jgi:hypothetical protein